MTEKNMSLYYWAEAVNTTNYILNRCITSGVHEVTPEECFYGRKPGLIFDELSSWYNPKQNVEIDED